MRRISLKRTAIPQKNSSSFYYIIALSYKEFTNAITPKTVTSLKQNKKVLKEMTSVFDVNFCKSFSTVSEFEVVHAQAVMYGKSATIKSVYMLYSDKNCLEGMPVDDYIVVAVCSVSGTPEAFEAARERYSNGRMELRREHDIEIINNVCERPILKEFVPDAELKQPGYSSHIISDMSMQNIATLACVYAFYCYGWLLLIRLSRDQIEVKLASLEVFSSSLSEEIVVQRQLLINIQRRFMLPDRSTHKGYKNLCEELKEKFQYENRFCLLESTHELIEKHLDNTTKILQLKKTKSLDSAIKFLTCLTVPFSMLGVLLAINLEASIIKSPTAVLNEVTLYILAFISLAVPVIIFILIRFLERRKQS